MFDKEAVLKLAKLSRLELSDAEIEKAGKHLDELINYMDNIRSLDLSGVEPMVSIEQKNNGMRKDEVTPSLSREKAFENAPKVNQNHFTIPKVMSGN